MEHSIIHIKAPHHIHIAAKVRAAQLGTSMNQYILDVLIEDLGVPSVNIAKTSIEQYRKDKPKNIEETIKSAKKAANKLCEHFQPKGECLAKGCKHAH